MLTVLPNQTPSPAMPASDSAVQRTAETRILELAGEQLGVGLVHQVWSQAQTRLANGAKFVCDGYCPDPLIYAEVFARQGALKGGQIHKVGQDILKLITVRRFVAPSARLVMIFADDEAARTMRGGGWLAEAAGAWDVETVVVTPDPKFRAELVVAQGRQRMVGLPVE